MYKSVPFTEKRPRSPETGIKDGFDEIERDFLLKHSVRKNRITFSGVPMLPEIFRWKDPKRRVLFTFPTDSPETFRR